MKTIILLILFGSFCCFAQTTEVSDPSGQTWEATSNGGYFWAGFSTGLLFYGFGFILRVARRTTGSSDF